MKWLVVLSSFIQLHGPGNQLLEINPDEIVSLRMPQSTEHFAPGVRCIVNTADGKFSTVQEDCDTVKHLIIEGHR